MDKFQHSLSVLLKAYLNDTLVVGSFCGCAVGNLVAEACGIKIILEPTYVGIKPTWVGSSPRWNRIFFTGSIIAGQNVYPNKYQGEAKEQIDATGYTWQELAKIEYAFEKGAGNNYSIGEDARMYAGLMAVVDVLADIHGIDLTTTQAAKLLFQKA